MKKAVYILLCLMIAINLTSCGNKATKSDSSKVAASNTTQENNVTDKEKQEDLNLTEETKDKAPQEEVKASEEDKNKNSNTKNKPAEVKNTKPASATQKPVVVKNNKVIVLDPGHANKSNLQKEPLAPNSKEMKIKDGGGAQGIITKTPEYQVNMNVALKLKTLLEAKGYTVVMTKTQNSQSLGNVERADIWNKANPALVLRLHADSSESSTVRGASMLVPAPINENTKAIYSDSKKYGQTVLNTLVKEVGMPNKGVVERSDMTGFNWSKVPVILVEMGFLSNKEEDKLLSSNDYQDKLAKGLADGIAASIK